MVRFSPTMNKVLCIFLVAVLAMSGLSCRKRDLRTISIDVPQMTDEASAVKVMGICRSIHGVDPKTVELDRARRTVTVTYDSMKLSIKNIEFEIAVAGYQANDVPANPMKAK